VPLVIAIGGVIASWIRAGKAQSAAADAKQTAVDNHEETKTRLDDLESGRVPVKVSEPAPTASDEAP